VTRASMMKRRKANLTGLRALNRIMDCWVKPGNDAEHVAPLQNANFVPSSSAPQ
jgi:hypothetical protein